MAKFNVNNTEGIDEVEADSFALQEDGSLVLFKNSTHVAMYTKGHWLSIRKAES